VTTQSSTTPSNWPARLILFGVAGATAVTFAHPSATRQYTWPWALCLALVWLIPVVAVLSRLARAENWTRAPGLLRFSLAGLVVITLLSALLSPFATLSLLRVWPTLAGVALFFWLHDWLAAKPARENILAHGLAGFGGLLAAVSLAGWLWRNPAAFWMGRNDVPFGHSNYTAGALLLVLPWLIRAMLVSTKAARVAWFLLTCTAGIDLLGTSSRGGVLAAVIVAATVAVLALMGAKESPGLKLTVATGVAALLFLAVLANPRLRDLVVHHSWSPMAKESNVQRSAMLQAGWRLGAERPVLGWGPGTIPLAYPKVRAELDGGVEDVLQLHSSPAQLWASLGSLGALIGVLLLLAVLPRQFGSLHPSRLRSTAGTAAATLLGYGLFSLTDHQLDLPSMNVLLVINLALLMQRPFGTVKTVRPGRFVPLVGGLATAALLILTGRDLLARRAFGQSLLFLDSGRLPESFAALDQAARFAPYDSYYRQRFASQLLEQRTKSADSAERERLTKEAKAQLEQSLAIGGLEEFAHFNLGWLALDANAPGEAIPRFLAAARESPNRSGVYFGLGLALHETGRDKQAVRAFALEWINDPIAMTAPVWEWPDFLPLRDPVRQESDRLLAEIAPRYPEAAYVRSLWRWWVAGTSAPAAGFDDESTAFVAMISDSNREGTAQVDLNRFAWGRLFAIWRGSPSSVGELESAPDFSSALVRRASRHPPPDWHGFLTAGLEDEAPLLVSRQFSRPGHGVLSLHADGPVPSDLYIRQENLFVSTFAAGLFPAKGWLPARELLERLPVPPATP
jgi:tetratricopeptide (TPR) repeat protein